MVDFLHVKGIGYAFNVHIAVRPELSRRPQHRPLDICQGCRLFSKKALFVQVPTSVLFYSVKFCVLHRP